MSTCQPLQVEPLLMTSAPLLYCKNWSKLIVCMNSRCFFFSWWMMPVVCTLCVLWAGLWPARSSCPAHQFNLNYIPISHLPLKVSSKAYILPAWWIVQSWIFSWAVNQSIGKARSNGCAFLRWMRGVGQVVLLASSASDISSCRSLREQQFAWFRALLFLSLFSLLAMACAWKKMKLLADWQDSCRNWNIKGSTHPEILFYFFYFFFILRLKFCGLQTNGASQGNPSKFLWKLLKYGIQFRGGFSRNVIFVICSSVPFMSQVIIWVGNSDWEVVGLIPNGHKDCHVT